MKIVLVEWLDCHCEDMWTVEDDARNLEPIVVKSVGYLIEQTETKVILSAMVSERTTMSMIVCIPRGSIVNITEIK